MVDDLGVANIPIDLTINCKLTAIGFFISVCKGKVNYINYKP